MTAPRLQTARLLLRPLDTADLPDIMRIAGDFEVSKWLEPVPHPYTRADALAFLNADADGALGTNWAIIHDARFIGVIGAAQGLGYWMDPAFWGKGLMTEAARAATDIHFQTSGATEMWSRYFTDNPRSVRVLQKLGFVEKGRSDGFCQARGESLACIEMQLTRERWQDLATPAT